LLPRARRQAFKTLIELGFLFLTRVFRHMRSCPLQAQPIVVCAGRAILMQMAVIDTGEEKCIALQVNGLALVSCRDPHVTDQHVRQTPRRLLSHTGPIRQGLLRRKAANYQATFWAQPMITGINCLPSPKTR